MAHTNCSDEEAKATLSLGGYGEKNDEKDEKLQKDMVQLLEIGTPTQSLKRRRFNWINAVVNEVILRKSLLEISIYRLLYTSQRIAYRLVN